MDSEITGISLLSLLVLYKNVIAELTIVCSDFKK